ncbi:MAG: DNA cytosine methyltransferase [Eggerthellaceae bacterium]
MRYVSLFSGIEAASVAWGPLGWKPMAFSEIEAFPCAVLKERFPDVPNLGDVKEVDWYGFEEAFGRPDVVVGGSPCQSFSVAGTRTGLDGPSGLMWEYVRAVRELRPEWLLWENVPGALSSSHGDDFRCLLESLDALGYGLAWRVLDAQFFGVAQRRERVFLVGRLGGPDGPCEVLFERGGMPWDPPSSREKRQELAAGAGGGAACAGFKYHASPSAKTIAIENEPAPTMTSDSHSPAVFQIKGNAIDRNTAQNGQWACDPDENGAYTLNSTDVDGVLAFAANQRGEVRLQGGDGSVTGAIPANQSGKQVNGVLCMGSRQGGAAVFDDMSPTLTSAAGTPGNNQPVICMADSHGKSAVDVDVAGTLMSHSSKGCGPIVSQYGEVAAALTARNDSSPCADRGHTVIESMGCVRRLTPRECERLQGFPDDWTLIPYRGKPADECPDTPRYKALGNSMAVPVMRWIGERIEAVEGS